MEIKQLLNEEFERRASISLEEAIKEIKHSAEEIVQLKEEIKKLRSEKPAESQDEPIKKEYIIEKKVNGYRGVLHKKGNEVRIYSDHKKDITFPFPTIVKQAKELSTKDFILDGEIVPYRGDTPLGRAPISKYIGAIKSRKDVDDSGIIFFIFDLLYFDNRCIMDQTQYERKKILLEQIGTTKNIKKIKPYIVSSPEEASNIIEKLGDLKGSEGAVIKRPDAIYTPDKETDAWIKYRIEIEIKCIVLDKYNVEGTDAYNYLLGIYVSEKEARVLNPMYLLKEGNKKILKLGRSFNSKISAEKGDIVSVNVEEVWRHKKDSKYRYSIHKPKIMERLDQGTTSSIDDLEAAVVSRGVEILESGLELGKEEDEGNEIEVRDFPRRMQENFRKVMKNKAWMPFIIQTHYRGHRITDRERRRENIPDRYKYKLDSIHRDARHLVPVGVKLKEGEKFKWDDKRFDSNYLEGITILSPTTSDMSVPDMLGKGEGAKRGKIRCVLKKIEPPSWARFEGIAEIGEPGSTPNSPALFVIIAKGYYTIHDVTDHKIRIEYSTLGGKINYSLLTEAEKKGMLISRKPDPNLKDLNGIWQYQIAHIGDKHIILMKLLDEQETELYRKVSELWKNKTRIRKDSPTKEDIYTIALLTKQNRYRPDIARTINFSEDTVFKYQKQLNLL